MCLTLIFRGDASWISVTAIICFFSLLSLNGKRKFWKKIDRLEALVESGIVHETHIVSDRCFELQGENDEDDGLRPRYVFDLGEQGTVVTNLYNLTSGPSFRKSPLFPDDAARHEENAITEFAFSISRRFPNSEFVVIRFLIEGRELCSWVRCQGRTLKPVRNIFFGAHRAELDLPHYEPMVVMPQPFDECLRQILEAVTAK